MLIDKKIKLTVLILLVSVSLFSLERESMEGIIYRQDTTEIMYTQREYVKESANNRQIDHIYYNTDGSEAAQESVFLVDGELVYYETVLNDIGMKGTIRRDKNNMIISYNEGKKSRERSIKWNDDLVAGPMLGEFIINNKDRVVQGEAIDFFLPFFDRQLLIPFKLSYIESDNSDPSEEIIIEMKLKNFLLGMLIQPIEFVLDPGSDSIKEIHGPTILPDPQSSNNNKTLFADIFYTYN